MSTERMLPEEAQKVLAEDVYDLIQRGSEHGGLDPETWNGRLHVREDQVFALLAAQQARFRGARPLWTPAPKPTPPRSAPAPVSRPVQTAAKPARAAPATPAAPVSAAKPRVLTLPELIRRGATLAGDEAVAKAAAAAVPAPTECEAEINRLIGFSSLRPAVSASAPASEEPRATTPTDAQRDAIARLVAVSTLRRPPAA